VFSRKKVEYSLIHSGAPKALARAIAMDVEQKITDITTTDNVYAWAYDMLAKRHTPASAARYSLKKAIMALGPTGYPFEQFVGTLFTEQGYDVRVGVMMEGFCVTHEVDVVAHKAKEHVLVETKFHNRGGVQTDVQVPLYIHSRFEDINEALKRKHGRSYYQHTQYIVTNTRFTKDAIRYGVCQGMHMIGWKYPEGEGLERRIEAAGLHPVTCLSTINDREKQALLAQGRVLCRDIAVDSAILAEIGVSTSRRQLILDEIKQLCTMQT